MLDLSEVPATARYLPAGRLAALGRRLVAPGVVLNKDGSFQRTARFRGPDLDSATQGELVATTARLNNALRRLGSGWALYVDAERRPAADYPRSSFPEALSWLVDEERRAAFEESASHFESRYHFTLQYLPPEESYSGRGPALRKPFHHRCGLARNGWPPSSPRPIACSTCSTA